MADTKNPQKQRKSEGRKVLLLILFLIAATIPVLILAAAKINPKQISWSLGYFRVRRDLMFVSLSACGYITAHICQVFTCQVQNRYYSSGSASGVIILEIVPAGTVITQDDVNDGKVLIQLDSAALEDRLATEKMTLATAEDAIKSANESYKIQSLDNQTSISAGQLKVEFEMMELQKYLGVELAGKLVSLADTMLKDVNCTTTYNALVFVAQIVKDVKNDQNILAGSSAGQQLKKFQDDIVMALGNLATQEVTLAGTQKLFDANFVSANQLQQDKLAMQNRRFSLENTRTSLALFLEYDFPKTTKQYLSNYLEAKRNISKIESQCRSRLVQVKSSVTSTQKRYDTQKEQVRQLEDQIEKCTIKAKAPGLVVYGSGSSSDYLRYYGSTGVIAEGETVTQGQTLISIPDTSCWIVETSIHETDVEKVRVGQTATIVMEAFPDKTLRGKVTEVAPLPDTQQSYLSPDVKVYKTLIKIEDADEALKSQMSCRIEILVENLADVIVVPIISVANRSGQKICWIVNSSGRQEERIVKTGSFNDKFVQITEGLEDGETILLNPPLVIDDNKGFADVNQSPESEPPPQTAPAVSPPANAEAKAIPTATETPAVTKTLVIPASPTAPATSNQSK